MTPDSINLTNLLEHDRLSDMGPTDAKFARDWQNEWAKRQTEWPTPKQLRDATLEAVTHGILQITGK